MGLNVALAIRFTPYYAKSVGWTSNLGQICGLLGFKIGFPDARDFVVAVSRWQAKNALDADGMLGPLSWRKMKPLLEGFSGQSPIFGPHPKWVYAIDSAANIPALPKEQYVGPGPTVPSNEDRYLMEAAKIAANNQFKLGTAVQVSSWYVARDGYPNGVNSVQTGLTTLKVGQEWQSLGGKRLIVGLTGQGPSSEAAAWGNVLFVTESGQGYEQTIKGFESDLDAYRLAGQDWKPLEKMLAVDAAFLNGIQAGLNFPLYATAHLGAWLLESKEHLGQYLRIAMAILGINALLSVAAPRIFGKVWWVIATRIWGSLWTNITKNITAENLAKTIGMFLASRAKSVFAALADETVEAAKLMTQILEEIAFMQGRAIPDAAKNAARDAVKDAMAEPIAALRKLGAEVTEDDMKIMSEEFKAVKPLLMPMLNDLAENVKGLL